MARLIDADAYLNILCGICLKDKRNGRCDDDCMVVEAVNTAPSIDIVRCKDCKYWRSDGGALMICDVHKDPTVPDHFCSYGERKDNE